MHLNPNMKKIDHFFQPPSPARKSTHRTLGGFSSSLLMFSHDIVRVRITPSNKLSKSIKSDETS